MFSPMSTQPVAYSNHLSVVGMINHHRYWHRLTKLIIKRMMSTPKTTCPDPHGQMLHSGAHTWQKHKVKHYLPMNQTLTSNSEPFC